MLFSVCSLFPLLPGNLLLQLHVSVQNLSPITQHGSTVLTSQTGSYPIPYRNRTVTISHGKYQCGKIRKKTLRKTEGNEKKRLQQTQIEPRIELKRQESLSSLITSKNFRHVKNLIYKCNYPWTHQPML